VLLSGSTTSVSLSGSYRWFAPSRLTPGEAAVAAVDTQGDWRTARFLKATADDVSRAPHALEYVLDYRLGRPGLKVFRSMVVRAGESGFLILPGIDAPARPLAFAEPIDSRLTSLNDGEIAIVFAYVEPWSRKWVVIDVRRTDAAGCLAHVVTWADFQAELGDRPALTQSDFSTLHAGLVRAGLDPPPPHEVIEQVPARELARPARALVRWLRYRV
jgi:hypothetical protein